MPYAFLAKPGNQFVAGYIWLYVMEMGHSVSFSDLPLICGMYIDANLGCSRTNDDNVLLHVILSEAVLEKHANLNKIQP